MKKIFLFLLSFLFFSALFYTLWIFLKAPYTTFLGHTFSLLSGVLDLPFVTTVSERTIDIGIRSTKIKIESLFLISNMVVLMALVMSTPSMRFSKKLVALLWAILLLFIFHILSLYIILIAHGIPKDAVGMMKLIKVIFLIIFSFSEQIGKVVIPFIIWLLFSHRYIFGKLQRQDGLHIESGRTGDPDPEGEKQDEEQGLDQNP